MATGFERILYWAVGLIVMFVAVFQIVLPQFYNATANLSDATVAALAGIIPLLLVIAVYKGILGR